MQDRPRLAYDSLYLQWISPMQTQISTEDLVMYEFWLADQTAH